MRLLAFLCVTEWGWFLNHRGVSAHEYSRPVTVPDDAVPAQNRCRWDVYHQDIVIRALNLDDDGRFQPVGKWAEIKSRILNCLNVIAGHDERFRKQYQELA